MNHFPTKILLATDASEDSVLAAQVAAELSSKTDSELHVVHVRSTLGQVPGYYLGPYVEEADLQRLDAEAQRLLNAQVEQIEAAGDLVTQAHLKIGRPDAEIVILAQELGADLLVVGSRGRGGIRRALMGSVSDSVVRHAHCPVLVVRREEKNEGAAGFFPTKLVVATDGSEEATLAADVVADIAAKTGSELHIILVGLPADYPGGTSEPLVTDIFTLSEEELNEINDEFQRQLDAQIEQIKAVKGIVAQAHLEIGKADEEIISLAEEIGAGLIALGSRGAGGLERALMGSVSDLVVRHAHCPVLVVRREQQQAR